MPEQMQGWRQALLRGYTRGSGYKVEEEKFQLDTRKKCIFHKSDPTMEPNQAVEYLSWDMKTLALSNLIQQELEEGPPDVPAPELLPGLWFFADR